MRTGTIRLVILFGDGQLAAHIVRTHRSGRYEKDKRVGVLDRLDDLGAPLLTAADSLDVTPPVDARALEFGIEMRDGCRDQARE